MSKWTGTTYPNYLGNLRGSFVIPPTPQRHTPRGKAKGNSLLSKTAQTSSYVLCSGFFSISINRGPGHPSKLRSGSSNIFFLPLILNTGPESTSTSFSGILQFYLEPGVSNPSCIYYSLPESVPFPVSPEMNSSPVLLALLSLDG